MVTVVVLSPRLKKATARGEDALDNFFIKAAVMFWFIEQGVIATDVFRVAGEGAR